jgi:histone deacetylase 1/2
VARPDIQFSVCLCARFQASPRTSHRQAVKRIFRYLRYTLELGLWYSVSSSLSLLGFMDADFAGCRVDRKSTSGTCQFLGSSLVSWSSRKQSSVAQSTTEAEYVVVASCCSQLLWITYMLSDCWWIKLVSTYDPQAYGPTPFSPRGFPRFLSIRGARG